MKTTLARYAELKSQEKAIAEEMKMLQPAIIEYMHAEDADKIESEFGNFSIAHRKKWKYSDVVEMAEKALEKALDEIKEKEMADGTATFEESEFLTFAKPKVVTEPTE